MCLLKSFCLKFDLRTGVFWCSPVRFLLWPVLFCGALLDPRLGGNRVIALCHIFYYPVLLIFEIVLICGALFRIRRLVAAWFLSSAWTPALLLISVVDSFDRASRENTAFLTLLGLIQSLYLMFTLYYIFLVFSYFIKIRDSLGEVIQQQQVDFPHGHRQEGFLPQECVQLTRRTSLDRGEIQFEPQRPSAPVDVKLALEMR